MSSSTANSPFEARLQDIDRIGDVWGLNQGQKDLLKEIKDELVDAYNDEETELPGDNLGWKELVDALSWCFDMLRTSNRLHEYAASFPPADVQKFLAPDDEELMMRRDALCMRMISFVESRWSYPESWRLGTGLMNVLDNPNLTDMRNELAHQYERAGSRGVRESCSRYVLQWLRYNLDEFRENLVGEVRRILPHLRDSLLCDLSSQ